MDPMTISVFYFFAEQKHRPQINQSQVVAAIVAGVDILDGARGGEADRNDVQGRYLESWLPGGRDVHGHTSVPAVLSDAGSLPDRVQLHTRRARGDLGRCQGLFEDDV